MPKTCAQTIVRASDWVGLTLPGMIEEPGSFSGIRISPRPARGPEASQRTSLPIFISAAARVRIAPWALTSASWAASASNLLGAVTNPMPVIFAISFATRCPKSAGAFKPVPTAVPPRASSCRWGMAASMCSRQWSSCETQPDISWPSVIGTASWRCVRPILTMPANSLAFRSSVSRSVRTAGISRRRISATAAMCMAVGKVSLEDWLRLTSSFGWIGFFEPSSPPRISIARLAMTSLAFMLVCVPLPVCQTTSGKWSSSSPSMTSSQAWMMAFAFSAARTPRSALTIAQAFLRMPKARIISRGKRSPPILKWASERSVWAPQYRSAGTSTLPIVSDSVRVFLMSLIAAPCYRGSARAAAGRGSLR